MRSSSSSLVSSLVIAVAFWVTVFVAVPATVTHQQPAITVHLAESVIEQRFPSYVFHLVGLTDSVDERDLTEMWGLRSSAMRLDCSLRSCFTDYCNRCRRGVPDAQPSGLARVSSTPPLGFILKWSCWADDPQHARLTRR